MRLWDAVDLEFDTYAKHDARFTSEYEALCRETSPHTFSSDELLEMEALLDTGPALMHRIMEQLTELRLLPGK